MWSEEQKAKARPRIRAACDHIIRAYDAHDYEQLWLLSGMVAGGLDNMGELLNIADELMRLGRAPLAVEVATAQVVTLIRYVRKELSE